MRVRQAVAKAMATAKTAARAPGQRSAAAHVSAATAASAAVTPPVATAAARQHTLTRTTAFIVTTSAMLAAKSAVRVSALAIALAAAAMMAGCSSDSGEVLVRPTPVRAAAATLGPDMLPIDTHGVVVNREETRLSFKVTGVIRNIAVEEGQAVRAGQRLAEIELTEIDAQVEQARLAAEKAQRDLARGERLEAERLISRRELQDLRTQAGLSQAQLESARFNRAHAVVVAPNAGIVLRKLAEERELVAAGEPVLILGLSARGYVVRGALADRQVVHVKLGDLAEVRLDAFPEQVFSAAVTEIAAAADERTGLFPVEVRFEAPPSALARGLVARLEIHPAAARVQSRTYVPIGAVIEGHEDRAAVFVVEDGRVRRREVRVAFFAPDSVALKAGVAPGERVVTEGARYLEDGAAIELLD